MSNNQIDVPITKLTDQNMEYVPHNHIQVFALAMAKLDTSAMVRIRHFPSGEVYVQTCAYRTIGGRLAEADLIVTLTELATHSLVPADLAEFVHANLQMKFDKIA